MITLLPFTLTTSRTLRIYIVSFGLLGGALGYLFTVTAWAGKGKKRCLEQRKKFIVLALLSLFFYACMLIVLGPEPAARYAFFAAIREFLMKVMLLANLLTGVGAALTVYFLVSVITISSSKLATTPKSRD
ncbi:MAG: hypothetical protein QN157_08930 [Armatimonadota bacterium]|nr:hypothetical protein [Armatimonadota bacterium]